MMRNLKALTLIAAVAFGATVLTLKAELGDSSKLPPASSKSGLTFEKDIVPLMEKSCLKCHGEKRPKSKYRVDSLAAIVKGGSSDEAAIIPGKSDKSPFVHYIADLVEEYEMPPLEKREKYPALTKEQIGVVRAWIDQGAK